MPKIGKIFHFWAQSQLFRTFLKMCLLCFSEIIHHGICSKVGKRDSWISKKNSYYIQDWLNGPSVKTAGPL